MSTQRYKFRLATLGVLAIATTGLAGCIVDPPARPGVDYGYVVGGAAAAPAPGPYQPYDGGYYGYSSPYYYGNYGYYGYYGPDYYYGPNATIVYRSNHYSNNYRDSYRYRQDDHDGGHHGGHDDHDGHDGGGHYGGSPGGGYRGGSGPSAPPDNHRQRPIMGGPVSPARPSNGGGNSFRGSVQAERAPAPQMRAPNHSDNKRAARP
ncbi:hypothetical protein [Solimonas marina]|uniref:hypothetical protein n=1 Tax=Solimonas marina TaxID=2714601 RepID=UPI0019D10E06|nr:hypothetical protein [Solimonas marina]